MKTIYLKEMRSYFTSTTGYIYIAMMQLIFGFYFFLYNMYAGYVDYTYVLSNVTTLILFAMPVLTMRLFSDETRAKTDQMIFTAPIATWQIVFGKFLAAITMFTITIVLTFVEPITIVAMGGALPVAETIGAYLSMYLMGFSMLAIGMYVSACTSNSIVSLVITIAIFLLMFISSGIGEILPATTIFEAGVCAGAIVLLCIFLYRKIKDIVITLVTAIVGIAIVALLYVFVPGVYEGLLENVLAWISLTDRYSDFYSGIFTVHHIVYYISVAFLFAFLTTQRIEKRRWS